MKQHSQSPRSIARMVGLGCLLAGASASLNGALLVSESFDYGSTTATSKKLIAANDHDGGTGWAGEWVAVSGGIRLETPSPITQNYPSLTTLAATGSRINDAYGGSSRREFVSSLPDTSYFSCLINWSGGTMSVGIGDGANSRWLPLTVASDGKLRVDGYQNSSTDFVQLITGVDYMVVSRRTSAGSNRTLVTSVFTVDSNGAFLTEPTTWDMTTTVTSGVAMARLDAVAGGGSAKIIDEIRIGESYAEVVGLEAGDVFATEKFDYTPGGALTGASYNGGTGWGAAWASSGLALRGSDDSLWYGSSQAFIADGTTMVDQSGTGANLASTRTLASSVSLGSNDLYYAMLVRSIGAPKGRFVLYAGGSAKAVVGFVDLDGDPENSELFVSASLDGYPTDINAANVTADALVDGTNYLLVMKRTGTEVSASLLAGDGSTPIEPTVWDVTDTGNTGASIDSLKLAVNNGILRIDEISMASTFGSAIANLTTSVPVGADPFDAFADPNFISNGDFTQATSSGPGLNGTQYRVAGSDGDYPAYDGFPYADVTGWTHYSDDPNLLATYTDDGEVLDGTDKLSCNVNTATGQIALNSSDEYLNGMSQPDILNGASINPNQTYKLVVDVRQNSGKDHSLTTFRTLLTVGTDVTDDTSSVVGSLLEVNPTTTLPTEEGTPYILEISGADLLMAQGSGQVNVIFDSYNTDTTTGFPAGPVDVLDPEEMSQVFIRNIELTFDVVAGDMNKDGVVDAADVALAQLYLDGDGGVDAATRQANRITLGDTAAEALDYLNLTDFDLDGDDTFDSVDVAAISTLAAGNPVIESAGFNGSNEYEVHISGLAVGTDYFLMKDIDLGNAPVFDIPADSVTATFNDATLIDDSVPGNQAFYQITD
jgi:hypothetical protein